jgi:flagellar basal body-associated protein FliL
MVGVLPLGNSVWLLVIIGVLIVLAMIVIVMATTYHMQTPVQADDNYDGYDDCVDGEWHQHVRVLSPPAPSFYDWENDA